MDSMFRAAAGLTEQLVGADVEVRYTDGEGLIDTLTTDEKGNIPDTVLIGVSPGLDIFFTAVGYEDSRLSRTTTATIAAAYDLPDVHVHLIVEDLYNQPTAETATQEIWVQNLDDPTQRLQMIGTKKPSEDAKFDYLSALGKNLRVYRVPIDRDGRKAVARVTDAPYDDVAISSAVPEDAGSSDGR